MPGACCTRGLVCNVHEEARTRAYRYSRSTPAFPAQGSVWGQKIQIYQCDAAVVFTFVSRSAFDLAAEKYMNAYRALWIAVQSMASVVAGATAATH